MIDYVANYWNSVLTVAAFCLAAVTGYYQIKDYRAQQAKIRIVEWEETEYGAIRMIDGTRRPVKRDYIDSSTARTDFDIRIMLENNGREDATISEFTLELPDLDTTLDLYTALTHSEGQNRTISLEGNDRQRIFLHGETDILDSYPGAMEGVLLMDSTAGSVSKSLEFSYWSMK